MSDDGERVTRARLTEAEGSILLKARFEAAGYTISENHTFEEEGVRVKLDGFDATRRVGYEFITTEAGDRAEFTPVVLSQLEDRMRKGELYLFLIDELDVDADVLSQAAERFLAQVEKLQGGPA